MSTITPEPGTVTVIEKGDQLPAQIDGTLYGYITFDTVEWLGEPYGFNELYVVATHPEDKDRAQQVVNLVKDKAEK